MTDQKNANEALDSLEQNNVNVDLQALKSSVDAKHGDVLLKDFQSDQLQLEFLRDTIKSLLGKLDGFDVDKINIEQAYQILNALRIMKGLYGKEFLARMLVQSDEALKFDSFSEFSKQLTMLNDANHRFEKMTTISRIMDEAELKNLVKSINIKHDFQEAENILNEEILKSSSSSELLRDSKLSEKVYEYIKGNKEIKSVDEFWDKLDASFFNIFEHTLNDWSKNTLNTMSVGLNFSFLEISKNINIQDIVKAVLTNNLDELKKKFENIVKFTSELELIGKDLKLQKKYDIEYYEVLNNPLQFSQFTNDYLAGKLDRNSMKEKILSSKKDTRVYPRTTKEDKDSIKKFGDELAPNFGENSFFLSQSIGLIFDKSDKTDKPFISEKPSQETPSSNPTSTEKPDAKADTRSKIEIQLDEAGIKNKTLRDLLSTIKSDNFRKFIIDIVLMFMGSVKLTSEQKGDIKDNEFLAGAELFLNKWTSVGTLFEGYSSLKGRFSKKTLDIFKKRSKADSVSSWQEFLTKLFNKKGEFVQKILGVDFETGKLKNITKKSQSIQIFEINKSSNKDGKLNNLEIFNLDKLCEAIIIFDEQTPNYKPDLSK